MASVLPCWTRIPAGPRFHSWEPHYPEPWSAGLVSRRALIFSATTIDSDQDIGCHGARGLFLDRGDCLLLHYDLTQCVIAGGCGDAAGACIQPSDQLEECGLSIREDGLPWLGGGWPSYVQEGDSQAIPWTPAAIARGCANPSATLTLAPGYFFRSLVSTGGVASSSLRPLRNSRMPRPTSPATLPMRPAPKSKMTINRIIPSSSGPRRMGKGPPYKRLTVRDSVRAQAIRKRAGLELAWRTKTLPR